MPPQPEPSHVISDVTNLFYALGGFVVAVTGLLAILLPAINKLKKDMVQNKLDTQNAQHTANTATRDVQALDKKVFDIAKDQIPPAILPPKLSDFVQTKEPEK